MAEAGLGKYFIFFFQVLPVRKYVCLCLTNIPTLICAYNIEAVAAPHFEATFPNPGLKLPFLLVACGPDVSVHPISSWSTMSWVPIQYTGNFLGRFLGLLFGPFLALLVLN